MENITKEQFDKFTLHLKEPEILKQYRINSFNNIKNSQLPSFRYGLNINIKPDFDFTSVTPKNLTKENRIIKHDNRIKVYQRESLNEFKFDEFLSSWDDEDDKLINFNQAFANDILAIHIPSNIEFKEPIELIYNIKENPFISAIFVLVESNVKAEIILTKLSNNDDVSYITDDIRVICKENSKVDIITVQNINKNSINIQRRKSLNQRDSSINWTDVCLGSKYTKSNIVTSLAGQGSNISNTVIFLASDSQKFDIYTASIHKAPQTVSNILTKGVLNNEAKALSRGLVKIEENAFNSNGYEKQEALLLSDKAEADAIPNLEIHNHDVRCTHGSTIGQIDKEKIFYLMSRGLNEEEAKKQIVEGYFLPVLEMFKDESIKEKIHNSILESLKTT